MPRLTLQRLDRVLDVPVGTDVLAAVLGAGLPLASSCSGRGSCKACLVEVLEGAEHLSPADERERRALAAARAGPGVRLACQARLLGDATVTTPYW